jgi:Uncharacterized protein conserved in bacteria
MPAVRTQASSTRKSLINLRVTGSERDMIDRAAMALGKNRTEFMLEAARRAAEEALLDQALFRLDADRFDAFRAALDAPANPPEALRELMKRKAPWEG